MTESGEELTVKGEFKDTIDSVFAFNSAIEVNYSMRVGDGYGVKIGMTHPAGEPAIFRMIFVLKGQICLNENLSDLSGGIISTHQHNLCRIPINATSMLMEHFKDDVICIHLSSAFLRKYIPETHAAHQRLLNDQPSTAPLMLAPQNLPITPEIATILQRLGSSLQDGFFDQLVLESKVIELLALQISQFETFHLQMPSNRLANVALERMNKAREILINHTDEQLSLRALAHLVGTNEFNLKRDFKTAFGTTVYGYLNQHKMEQAKALLLENDESISEIARKMGYRYPTHFTSAFKKYFGYLPNKLRAGKLSLLFFAEDLYGVLDNFDFALI